MTPPIDPLRVRRLRQQQEALAVQLSEHATRALSLVAAGAAAVIAAESQLRQAVEHARGAGASWTDVGKAAGLSRQGARQRWAAYEEARAAGDGTGPAR